MTAVAEPEILSALDPEQRSAAEAVRGPVCILAGAGTGKTRAITHRIAFAVRTGTVSPAHVLAVTFTARAAGELRGRLRGLGVGAVQARTFHSAALRQLQYFWPRTIGGELPAILKSKVPLLAEVAGRLRLGLSSSDLRDVACEIEWMKALQRPPDDYASSVLLAHRIAPRPVTEMTALYAGYEDLKVRKNQFDFEDLLLHATALLETEPEVAMQVRDQYRYFVVDEYQDVNPAQQRLLDAWLGERDDLCVVGDPEQTIYSFAGASPDYLTGFSTRYPKATVVRLVRDYRSTPQVVALANRLSGGALVAQLPAGPVPVIDSYSDEVAEAAAVATKISRLIADGTPASEIAVLFRINAQSETFEQALAEAGVPYVLRGGERFFERPEVREAVFLLRGAARGEQSDEGTLADAVRGVLAAVGFGPAPPSGSGVARDRWESLAALVRLAEERVGAGAAAESEPRWILSPTSKNVRRCSTRPLSTASRWRRCTPRKGSSGTPCSWSGWSTARCRSSTQRRPHRSTRNVGCSTSASPGPAVTSPSPGRRRGLRAGAPVGVRAVFSTTSARPRPAGRCSQARRDHR